MKKNFKIAFILMAITLIAALAISGLNMLTSPIIASNDSKKEEETCQKIFASFDGSKSSVLLDDENDSNNDNITKLTQAKDSSGQVIGYIYKASGSNSYGDIVLLVGLDSTGKLASVKFLTNGQSFSSEVNKHVNSEYVEGLDSTDVNNIDTSCGATFGAKLVKKLVTACLNDFEGGNY